MYAGNVGVYGVPARVWDVIPEMKSPLLLLIAGQQTALAERYTIPALTEEISTRTAKADSGGF